jgi:hypothetical protein
LRPGSGAEEIRQRSVEGVLRLDVHDVAARQVHVAPVVIVYPKGQSPSFADQVLALLEDHDVQPGNVYEVSEMQIALGLAAAVTGVCVVPYAASHHRTDLLYCVIDDEHAISPVILSHRRNDSSEYIVLVKRLLQELYATSPARLDPAYNTVHGQRVGQNRRSLLPTRSELCDNSTRPRLAVHLLAGSRHTGTDRSTEKSCNPGRFPVFG